MKYFFLFASLCLIFTACSTASDNQTNEPELPQVVSGTLVRIDTLTSKYVTDRTVDIWLPEGYSNNQRYPVLYMHDGQMLYDSAKAWNKQEWGVDDVFSKLIKDKKIPPTIVVGVWNGGKTRHPDYFPQKPFESLPKSFTDSLLEQGNRESGEKLFSTTVNSDNYLKYLVEELKPFIDKNYATLPDSSNTFVAGSSMGGLISMYAICEYPNIFSGAACLSTHWPGIFTVDNNPIPDAFIAYLEANLPSPTQHKIYFDYGTETLDALYEPFQQKVDSVMIKKGFDEKSWLTMKFPGENHSEIAWNKRLHIPVSFILN